MFRTASAHYSGSQEITGPTHTHLPFSPTTRHVILRSRQPTKTIVKAEKQEAPDRQRMVRPSFVRTGLVNTNRLPHGGQVSGDELSIVAPHREIEARIPERATTRHKGNRSIVMKGRLHDHEGIPVRKRERHLEAHPVPTGYPARAITSRVQGVAGAHEVANPDHIPRRSAGWMNQMPHRV